MSGEREKHNAQPIARIGKSIKDMEKREQEEKIIVKRTQGKRLLEKRKRQIENEIWQDV